MPIAKPTDRQAISLDRNVYGSLPVDGFPEPTENEDAQIAYWHKDAYGAGQWVFGILRAGTGIDLDYDPATGIITLTNHDYRKTGSFTADAVIMPRFTADAVLV